MYVCVRVYLYIRVWVYVCRRMCVSNYTYAPTPECVCTYASAGEYS